MAGAEAGAGTPILLLHGLGGTWVYWQPHAGAARRARPPDRARRARLRRRRTRRPAGSRSTAASDRLAAALRALGGSPAVVCGHSMGGPLAVRLAVRHPDAVSRLILVGPSGFAPSPAWQRRIFGALPLYRAPPARSVRVGALARAGGPAAASGPRPARGQPGEPRPGRGGAPPRGRPRRPRAARRRRRVAGLGLRGGGAPRAGADRGDLGRPRPHRAPGRRRRAAARRALGCDPHPARPAGTCR